MTQINRSPRPRRCAALLGLLAWSLAVAGGAHAQTPQVLPTVQLTAGIHVIRAMVADSPEERATGLMYRTQMGTNEGMLFVFEDPAQQCFWMKNTLLPLSAAFVDDEGRIANIEDMAPQTLESHCSAKPVRFVLEMNKGWFAKRGLKAGSRLSGPPFK